LVPATMEVTEMAKHRSEAHEPMASDRSAKRKAGVERDLARLGGRSRADVERDDQRGASSPLGKGSHSKREKELR
jgi:hypothetical protein